MVLILQISTTSWTMVVHLDPNLTRILDGFASIRWTMSNGISTITKLADTLTASSLSLYLQ